ncbi:translation initiation factor IF-3 [Ardenticatena maritima]|uniref:Translation initiation factor IF-3 n=1 Tax=Ardenticatena maritima TaxID=872965 RepID=A0A0P6Y5F0_9CHLR|nr:translation initiation factor IF-3 [Ardenticatena maritima]KPL87921.1 translation initiation factor IF-3 [Ardenticatena maritima]
MSERQFRVNEQIRVPEVRLIDEKGQNRGVVPTKEALAYADSVGLDLVEVAPEARPPVCRVMNYSKFLYEQSKREREARKAQKQIEVKELRLRPKTDDHHIGFKLKQARKFIEKGHKVRIRVLFRGRERSHPEIGQELLMKVAEELSDIAVVEQKPVFEGRDMSMVLAPDTDKKKKK